ncbi:hypothetical protein PIROE2DRAFT_1424 [Piromyces sp. E2]|nr:hypothetical protein PIROE2DRAFT_1424 [Piromyces sp. E2]|eukprot:OUM70539.1 hypothetical protein PIROE2DRAFT_1424 [Piromyces sp. E2]
MEEILRVSERNSNYTLIVPENVQKGRIRDAYQKVILSYFQSPFFLWVVFIVFMNKKNWKRPIMMLLIIHWLFRSTGDLLNKVMDISPGFSVTKMYIGTAFANVFWSLGEIIGDWYPLLRTKAIVNNKKKIKIVFITCGIYNITKICSIGFYFVEIPILLNSKNPNTWNEYNLRWWSVVAAIQSFKNKESITLNTNGIENIRRIIININFTLSYIDQILLRFYVDHRNKSGKRINFNSSSKSIILNNKYYKELQNPNFPSSNNQTLFNLTSNIKSHSLSRINSTENILKSDNNNNNTYFHSLSRINNNDKISDLNNNSYIESRSGESSNTYFEALIKINKENNINNYEIVPEMIRSNMNNVDELIHNNMNTDKLIHNSINKDELSSVYNTESSIETINNNQNNTIVYSSHHRGHSSDVNIFDYYNY